MNGPVFTITDYQRGWQVGVGPMNSHSNQSDYDQRQKRKFSTKQSMYGDYNMKNNSDNIERKKSNDEIDSHEINAAIQKEHQSNKSRTEEAFSLDDIFIFAGNCSLDYLNFEENTFPQFKIDEHGVEYIEQSLSGLRGSKNASPDWTLRFENTQLVLFQNGDASTRITYLWQNILGASYKKIKHQGQFVYQFFIHLMKVEEKSCCSARNRKHTILPFKLDSEAIALRLEKLIQTYSRCQNYFQIIAQELKCQRMPVLNHKLLVFANPVGGDGTALEKWQSVSELFRIAGYQIVLIETQYQNHAKKYVNELPKNEMLQYRGIVTISGDGLTHEIINGLLSRPDADEIMGKISLGGLQGGSGNALVGSILHECNEPMTLQAAAYQIIKGKVQNMDLTRMQTRKIPAFYSFLSLAWAFIADVDLNSEHLRCFAGFRFDIMGAFRAAFQRKHKGILSFTENPIDQLPDIDEEIDLKSGGWQQEKMQSFKHLLIMNTPMITTSDLNAPNCKIGDGSLDLQYLNSSKSWWQMVNFIFNFQSGNHFNKNTGQPAKGLDFVYKKIKAFRLEAIDTKGLGLMSVDGERYDSDIIQGIVLPGKLRVFSM